MFKKLLIGSVLLPSFAMAAATGTFKIEMPTQNTDNSVIPTTGPGALASSTLEWGTCATPTTFGNKIGEQIITAGIQPGAIIQAVVNSLPYKTTLCFRSTATNNIPETSAFSNIVSIVTSSVIPKPPTLTSVTSLVWELKRNGRLELVGNIAIGSTCVEGPGYQVGDVLYYELAPGEAVDFTTQRRIKGTLVTMCA